MRRMRRKPNRGFTLVEILVVIGIIAILASILLVVVGNMISNSRKDATAATILKIQKLLDQRMEAFDRRLQGATFDRVFKKQFDDLIQQVTVTLQRQNPPVYGVSPEMLGILARKVFFKNNFPQRFLEFPGADQNGNGVLDSAEDTDGDGIPNAIDPRPTVSDTHDATTESSELLYYVLTKGAIFGVEAVDESEFTSSEVADTDGDGLLEFVDAWGRPLQFYRWPTRLIKPWGAEGQDNDIDTPLTPADRDRATAGLLISGLPAPPTGSERDQLDQDPDDPTGRITREAGRLASLSQVFANANYFEAVYHTIDTWHRPLIVSAGADGELGLYFPHELDVQNKKYGTLAQPRPNELDALTDNITNRNQRAAEGGR